MNRSIILTLAFVALVYSQQTSITITPLTAGVLKTGTLPITTQASASNADVYSIVIPAGIPSFDVVTANTGASTACTYIAFNIRDEAPACSEDLTTDFMCTDGKYSDAIYGGTPETNTYELDGTGTGNLFQFVQNRTIYISASKDSTGDYDEVCTYSLQVNFPATAACPAGQVSYDKDGTYICQALNDIVFGTTYTALSAENTDLLYRVQVPAATGTLYVTGVFNDTITITGRQYASPAVTDCSATYQYSNNSMYYITLTCNVPRVGDFYIALETDSDETINGTFTVTVNNCSSTTGGHMCNFPLAPFPTTAAATTVTVNVNTSLEASNGISWAYYWFDLPAVTAGPIIISATGTATSGTAYMYLRRGGFPDYNNYEGSSIEYQSLSATSSSFYLNVFDYIIPGRMYFGVGCNSADGASCTITFSRNSTAGGVITTGTTTADASTTEQTSSSVVVVFSAVLLFIAALF